MLSFMPSSLYRCFLGLVLLSAGASEAQWNYRYPQVAGYRHHVYLEGFELPVMGAGPTDPAPSPDGKSLAFAARGWLWLLDLETGEARRLTSGRAIDARPGVDVELRHKDDCGRGIGNELPNHLERGSRLLGLAEANVHLGEPQSSRYHIRPPLDDVLDDGDRFTEPLSSFRLFSAQAV